MSSQSKGMLPTMTQLLNKPCHTAVKRYFFQHFATMLLLDLPLDVWQGSILPKLGLEELNSLRMTCKALHQTVDSMQDYSAAWLLQDLISNNKFSHACKKHGELVGFWSLPLPGIMSGVDFFRWYLARFNTSGLPSTRQLQIAALWGDVEQAQLAFDKIDKDDMGRTSTLVQAFLGACYTNQEPVLTWLASLKELGMSVRVPLLRRSYVESYLKEAFAQACLEGHVTVVDTLIRHFGLTPPLMLQALFTCLYLTPSSVDMLKYLLEDLQLSAVDPELEPELLIRLQAGFHYEGATYMHKRMEKNGKLATMGTRPTSPSSPKGRRTSALLQRTGSSQRLRKRVSSRRLMSALPENGSKGLENSLEDGLTALDLEESSLTFPRLPSSAQDGSVLNLSTSNSATASPALIEEPSPDEDAIASFIATTTGQVQRSATGKGTRSLTRASSRHSLQTTVADDWNTVLSGMLEPDKDRRVSEQAASNIYAMW
eukprot:m.74982 g.74982  ORF g.74982 m.74982 type:complete len:485 (-) comp14389_c0_seq1:75-1529(-)